jgi:predicted ATPase/DNA-binding winged helix-turn-helix (wHTH) protein
MLTRSSGGVYASNQCEVDLDRRELRLQGAAVPIGGRAFDIIEVLAQSAGQLVTKDELMDRVWPGAIVEDNTLQVHISAVRKALGSYRGMLKTESGRGYRLLGDWSIRHHRPTGPSIVAFPKSGNAVPLPSMREAPEATASNLPVLITGLIGRSASLPLIRELLSAYRVVTLTGPGGIGKTTLALHVACELRTDFDGSWLVELASLSDPELVPSAAAAALGLKLGDINSSESVARAIGATRLLLLLDNCEHVVDAAAELAETLVRHCPRVTILATSRETLRIEGEYVYRVSPLDVPALTVEKPDDLLGHSSIELFIARMQAQDSSFTPDAATLPVVAEICRHLDGIPLAIEFAVARAATLGLPQIAAMLDDRFRLLTSGRRTAIPRHQTLRATLDWSYELLAEPERILLRRLAAFIGPFALEAISAVVTGPELAASAVLGGIAGLIEKSLLQVEISGATARHRLLDTTRVYALEKLHSSGEFQTVVRRHAEFYRDLFDRAEAESETRPIADWLEDYGWRIHNLRAALDWAFSPDGDVSSGVALTAAAIPLWMYLSLMEECRYRVERALGASAGGFGEDARSEMRLNTALAASLMYTRGAVLEVGAAGTTALEIAESLDDAEYQLRSLFGLWSFHINSDQQRVALHLAHRFRALAAKRSDPNDGLIAERMIGTSQYLLGDLITARHHLERVLAHDVAPAPEWRIIRFEVDQRVAARAYLARVLWLQGLPQEAMRTAESSVADARVTNHAISLGLALAIAACPLALRTGDLTMAEYYAEMLLDHSTTHALARWRVFARSYQAMLVIQRGELGPGLQLLRAALDDQARAGFLPRLSAFHLAEALGRAGQVADGLAVIEEAIVRAERSEEGWSIAELLRIKGELVLLHAEPRAAAAEGIFRQALDYAHRQGALSWELRCATSLARLQRDQPQSDEAFELLASVYNRFTEGFDTADLKAAKALLEGR